MKHLLAVFTLIPFVDGDLALVRRTRWPLGNAGYGSHTSSRGAVHLGRLLELSAGGRFAGPAIRRAGCGEHTIDRAGGARRLLERFGLDRPLLLADWTSAIRLCQSAWNGNAYTPQMVVDGPWSSWAAAHSKPEIRF